MLAECRAQDLACYRREYDFPFAETEPSHQEIAAVWHALSSLRREGILLHTQYDHASFLAHREQVWSSFVVEWSTITPRMQRLLYAINAIFKPARMLAAGIASGYAFISNAGAAIGVGREYAAQSLVGIEIDSHKAAQAASNIRKVDRDGVAGIVEADAVKYIEDYPEPVDLLYLDAGEYDSKAIYLDILKAGRRSIHSGTILLAHDSVRFAVDLKDYLAWVRDDSNCLASVNVIIDNLGLEVSVVA